MLGYGRDESAPTPDGMFATCFVGECCVIGRLFAAFWQTFRSCRGPIYRARESVYTHEMGNENAHLIM